MTDEASVEQRPDDEVDHHFGIGVGGDLPPGDATTDYAQMFNALAGTKFKIVKGYKSTADILRTASVAECVPKALRHVSAPRTVGSGNLSIQSTKRA